MGLGGKKKQTPPRCLLKGTNASICETASLAWLRKSIQSVFLLISISEVMEDCVYRPGKGTSSFECSKIMLRYGIIPDILLSFFLFVGTSVKRSCLGCSLYLLKVPEIEYLRIFFLHSCECIKGF